MILSDVSDVHKKWIEENYPTYESAYGNCAAATTKMVEAFPELKRVRGHYYCAVWGEREHWWCELNGTIVDPTAVQFPTKGIGRYIPWDEDAEEPTGKCMECGDYCYDGHYFCCDSHEGAWRASLRM